MIHCYYHNEIAVPLYEVVEIQSPKLQKRSVEAGHHIKIRAFGDEIEHYLTPLNDVFVTENTPIKEAMYDSKKRKLVVRRSSVVSFSFS